MKNRALLLAAAVAMVVWGCQSVPHRTSEVGAASRKHCQAGDDNPAHCVIQVTSVWCSFFKCTPWVDYDVLVVDGTSPGKGNRIQWVLSGPGAEFAEPPIVFESGAAGFTCKRNGPKVAECGNEARTEKGKAVKYSIRLVDTPELDPFVINN
jgi:hypothetical protein